MKLYDTMNFIKKNWIPILIAAVVLTVLIALLISSHNQRMIERDLYNTEVNSIRRNLIDSIAKVQAKKDISLIDSLNSIRDTERKEKEKKVLTLLSENKELKKQLRDVYDEFSDNIDDIVTCKRVVDVQKDVILNQDTIITIRGEQIDSYKLTLNDLNRKYDVQLKETLRTKTMYDGCQADVATLTNRLNKQPTWWRKNEKWIFLGAGALGGILIAK